MSIHQILSILHLLLVTPLFFYVSLTKDAMPSFMFPVLLGLGIFVALYQTYKAYIRYPANLINLFHILIVAPVLIYIGYMKTDASRFAYELLLMLAFAVTGYHGYYLIRGE
jgi:hypothetical protein